MLQEENILLGEKNSEENEFPQEIYNFPSIKLEPFFSIKTNIFGWDKTDDISLEEMKKIMNGPKIDLEEDDYEKIYFTKNGKSDLQSTDGTTKIQSVLENKEETSFKNVNFTTILRKKRGRKTYVENLKKNKRCHCSDDFDNILRKIQVHFISFLVNLANDSLKQIFGEKTKLNFKHVDYELKKIVNHNYIELIKKCKYSDIMKMKISPKNKKFSKNSNKETFENVCEYSDILKKIFDGKYLYIFQKYYCNITNDNNIIDLEGLKMTLSPKTKTLYNLLAKNESTKEKFKNVINDVYFSEFNYNSNKKFLISPFS
jgi:hypothetical protein